MCSCPSSQGCTDKRTREVGRGEEVEEEGEEEEEGKIKVAGGDISSEKTQDQTKLDAQGHTGAKESTATSDKHDQHVSPVSPANTESSKVRCCDQQSMPIECLHNWDSFSFLACPSSSPAATNRPTLVPEVCKAQEPLPSPLLRFDVCLSIDRTHNCIHVYSCVCNISGWLCSQ